MIDMGSVRTSQQARNLFSLTTQSVGNCVAAPTLSRSAAFILSMFQ